MSFESDARHKVINDKELHLDELKYLRMRFPELKNRPVKETQYLHWKFTPKLDSDIDAELLNSLLIDMQHS